MSSYTPWQLRMKDRDRCVRCGQLAVWSERLARFLSVCATHQRIAQERAHAVRERERHWCQKDTAA